jgi:DMSO/TMAO reductase YedYZ molybdopterin-dependent catalytic subunit
VSVGEVLVDVAPIKAVRASIAIFGTNDKPALLIGIVVATLVITGLLGVLAASRRWIGAAGFALFGVFGAWAGTRNPMASDIAAVLVAVVAIAVGIGALFWLLGKLGTSATAEPVPGLEHETAPGSAQLVDRRGFVTAAVVVGVGAAASAYVGRLLGSSSVVEAARSGLSLVATAETTVPTSVPAPGAFSAADYPGLSSLFTPNETFYRIDTALQVPQVDPARWRLRFTGMVDNPYELTFDELLAMPLVEQAITLSCVSNRVGGGLVGNATWLGVPLTDLLDVAGVQPGATQVVGRSVDDFTVGFPTAVLEGDRPALVAVGMNGEPLPAPHGFPARLVVSGLYGYVSATKWLTEVELTTLDAFDAYWIPRGWAKEAPIKTQSRIDVPRTSRALSPGTVPVAGVAWAPSRDIVRVEVQVDDQPWAEASLGERVSEHSWRQWVYLWDAEPGEHQLRVRATDGTGETQTEEVHAAPPDGATGWHTIEVDVSEV